MLGQRYQWCLRRLLRTSWLLRQHETRAETALYLLTEGSAYAMVLGLQAGRALSPSHRTRGTSVLDARNALDAAAFVRAGLTYRSLGRDVLGRRELPCGS